MAASIPIGPNSGSVSYSINNFASGGSPLADLRCKAGGHRVGPDDDLLVYVDGVAIAHCQVCDDRIEFARIPTGIAMPRVKTLVDRMVNEGPTVEVMQELRGMLDLIREMGDELAEVIDAVMLANEVLAQKWK